MPNGIPENRISFESRLFLAEKYLGEKIDLVIALDDAAVELVTKFHTDFFPETPVVFASITSFNKYSAFGRKNITGVLETQDIKNTVDMILRFHPDTREIVGISDATVGGLSGYSVILLNTYTTDSSGISPNNSRWSPSCARPRKWNPWAVWPEGWPMILTT